MILIFVKISVPFWYLEQTLVNGSSLNYNHNYMYGDKDTSSSFEKDPIFAKTLPRRDIASNLLRVLQPKNANES